MNACYREGDLTMDPSILILLLSAGADPNAQNDIDFTALIVAASILAIKKVLQFC